MARLLVEFVGTFFLMLIIALAVAMAGDSAPLAITFGLTALVYMGAAISGAHYNPAVTVALLLTTDFRRRDVFPYIGVQFLGAVTATWIAAFISGVTVVPGPGPDVTPVAALLAEVLFTFLLVLVILNVGVAARTRGNPYAGVAIGLTVGAGAYAVGATSGAAFNPAIGVGPAVATLLTGRGFHPHVWLYVVGPLVGAVLAVLFYRVQESAMAGADRRDG